MPALEPIPSGLVDNAWPLAEPWVRLAVERAALIESVESYKDRCLARTAQLWLIRSGRSVTGCFITETYDTPKGQTCAVPVAAADDMDEALVPALEAIEGWAKSEGCVRLEGFGRQGWVRALKDHGWRPLSVVIEKDI